MRKDFKSTYSHSSHGNLRYMCYAIYTDRTGYSYYLLIYLFVILIYLFLFLFLSFVFGLSLTLFPIYINLFVNIWSCIHILSCKANKLFLYCVMVYCTCDEHILLNKSLAYILKSIPRQSVGYKWIIYVFDLSCVCYVFVRVCLYVLCCHLLGKG